MTAAFVDRHRLSVSQLAEFKQSHGFQGLPFDMMCDNSTDAGEGGGHGHE